MTIKSFFIVLPAVVAETLESYNFLELLKPDATGSSHRGLASDFSTFPLISNILWGESSDSFDKATLTNLKTWYIYTYPKIFRLKKIMIVWGQKVNFGLRVNSVGKWLQWHG